MTKYLSYDIEIYDDFPEDGNAVDLREIRPSIAGIATQVDGSDIRYYFEQLHMGKKTARKVVKDMLKSYEDGYVPFTWNGLGFDFKLLAYHSEMIDECAFLALNHVDGMFMVVAQRGYMLGLDKVLIGCGLESKLHEVKLKDGIVFSEMSGAHAPRLWREGNYFAVRDYLRMDVLQPLKLIEYIKANKMIRWTSNSGKINVMKTELLTVKECLRLPLRDVSWMTEPKPREYFYNWIPKEILKREADINETYSTV